MGLVVSRGWSPVCLWNSPHQAWHLTLRKCSKMLGSDDLHPLGSGREKKAFGKTNLVWKNKNEKKIGSYAESHVEGLVEQQKEIHYLAKGGLFKSNFRAQVGCQSRTLQKPGRLKQKWYRIQEFHWSGVLMERIALTRNTKGLYRKLSRKGQHVLWAWMSSWWLLGWNKGEATMKPWLHADPQLLHWLLQWSLAWSADVLL